MTPAEIAEQERQARVRNHIIGLLTYEARQHGIGPVAEALAEFMDDNKIVITPACPDAATYSGILR